MENNVGIILQGLNPRQKEAVENIQGPALIVAGAGSGKTRVLTSRIAYTMALGCDPYRILALTFTRKAAGEMRERIASMVGERRARRLWMGTFHSVFIRFLREWAAAIGYPAAFTIYDTSDSQSAIKRCIKDLQLDDKVYKPKEVLGRISNAKNSLVTPEAYAANAAARANDAKSRKPEIYRIYAAYQDLMRKAGVMDFDDILLNMNLLLDRSPEALEAISGRFDYILVDEYQDTNFAQYLILKRLAARHGNICVVGDDSQSIYGFRGARIENMLNFQRDYPRCRVFRLEQNYRSTKNIVDAANSLIAKNSDRIPKKCYSEGDTGEKIRIVQAYTELEEALLVASSIISRMQSDGAAYQDFAILYRTNSQSRALEEALRKRNLPYAVLSGNSFFDRAEVKDMMAYFKLAANPSDDESFRRAVGRPSRGIGETTVDALSKAAADAGVPLLKAIYMEGLEAFGLRPAAVSRLRTFADMFLKANASIAETDAYELAARLSDESGLYRSFKEDNTVESQSRAGNIEELVSSVREFVESRHNEQVEDLLSEGTVADASDIDEADLPVVTLPEWLENISLLSSVDRESEEDTRNRISLMTVHSAKGLEFPYVYVTGMEENLFPSLSMLATARDIEEERRLFYVAITRAEKTVTLTHALTRMRNGKHESNSLSRFVREIDSRYLANPPKEDDTPAFGSGGSTTFFRRSVQQRPESSRPKVEASRPKVEAPRPLRPFSAVSRPVARPDDKDFEPVSALELKAGQRIEHNRFGYGKILEISGGPADLKARIVFDQYGEKILLLKYAKIRFPKD